MKFNHIGIPTTERFEGEIDLPHLKMTVSDHQSNPFGIQWQRYWEWAPYPDVVKSVPHVAFAVKPEDLAAWREQLRQAAIPIEREVEWEEGGHSIYFRDPAGNVVELAPPTIWGGGWKF